MVASKNKILGIDPGYGICGWGVIKIIGNHLQKEAYGIIKTKKKDSFTDRLLALQEQLVTVIKKYAPDEVAVEEIFFTKNVKTAIAVGQARGVIILTCAQAKLKIFEYKPNEVKLAVTGYGAATKIQIKSMTKILLNLQQAPKIDDAADALAVAICHANSKEYKRIYNDSAS